MTVLDLGYLEVRDAKRLFSFALDNIQPQEGRQGAFQLRNLQKLSLVLERITDTLMLMVCQNLPCLTDLELQDAPGVEPLVAFDLTTTGLQQLGACSKLERLMVVRSQAGEYPAMFKRVEDMAFYFLAEKCMKLVSIKLGGFAWISDAACSCILKSFPDLHTFELLDSCRVTDLAFRDFPASSDKLVSLTLASCNLINDSSIKQISFCRRLESLNLKGCRSVGDGGLEAIGSLDKLKILDLNGVDVSDAGLTTLGKGRTPLACLSLRSCQRVSDEGIAALVDGHIAQTLQRVDLSYISALTDRAVLSLIYSGMRIVDLRLRACSGIGDTSLKALASMTCGSRGSGGSMRLLDLWNCTSFTALSIGWFKKPYFPRLRWLGLCWPSLMKSELDFVRRERPYVRIIAHGVELDCHEAEKVLRWSFTSL